VILIKALPVLKGNQCSREWLKGKNKPPFFPELPLDYLQIFFHQQEYISLFENGD